MSLTLLIASGAATRGWGQAGALDASFQSRMESRSVKALAVQPDGKVLLAGDDSWRLRHEAVQRLHADGLPDATFAADAQDGVAAVGLQSDGRVVAFGWFASGGYMRSAVRYDALGAREPAFEPRISAYSQADGVESLAMQSDGRMVIAGEFITVNGVAREDLARLNTDGTLDAGFVPAVRRASGGSRCTVIVQPDGRILVSGGWYGARGVREVVRLEADGTLDPTFDATVQGTANSMTLLPDGRIVLGGLFPLDGRERARPVIRLMPSGALDAAFDSGPATSLAAAVVAAAPGGKVLAVTMPSWIDGVHAPVRTGRRLVRFAADGTLDPTFVAGAGADGDIHALHVLADGRILAAGAFSTWDGWPARSVVRLFGGEVAGVPAAPADLAAVRESRARIQLTWTGALDANGCRIERSDGAGWREVGRVRAGERAFGDRTARPGVAYEYRVVAWNGLGSAVSPTIAAPLEPEVGAGSLDPDYAPLLTAEAGFSLAAPAPDGGVFVAGDFQFINGEPRTRLARFRADGTLDPHFLTETPADDRWIARSVAALADGRVAVAYGRSFSLLDVDAAELLHVLAPDGRLLMEVAPTSTGPSGFLVSTSVDRVAARENRLYYVERTISGSWSSRWTVKAVGLPVVAAAPASFDGEIAGLAPLADGAVLLWGAFTRASGETRPGLARLKADLSLDAWKPSGLPAGRIVAVAPGPAGTIFAAVQHLEFAYNQVQIVRLLASGAVDPAFPAIRSPEFAPRFSNGLRRMWVRSDGSLLAVFREPVALSTPAGPLSSALLRYTAAGALDEAWSRAAGAIGAVDLFVVSEDARALAMEVGTAMDSGQVLLRQRLRWVEADGRAGALLAGALRTGAATALALRPDGALAVAQDGHRLNDGRPYTAIHGTPRTSPALLREDGSLDPEFGFTTEWNPTPVGGYPIPANVRLQFDGADRLVVSGAFTHFNGLPRPQLARLAVDGTTDEDFVPQISESFAPGEFALCPDGRIVAAGPWYSYTPIDNLCVLDADGRLRSAPAGASRVFGLSAESDGAVLLQSATFMRSGMAVAGPARLRADGAFDSAYTQRITGGDVRRCFALPDGKAIVVGTFTRVDDSPRPGLARLRADGSLDPTFDPGLGADGIIEDLAAQADGKVLIVGEFMSYDRTPRTRVARLRGDGSLDADFRPGEVDGPVRRVLALGDGRIYLAGEFSAVDGLPRTGLARLLPGAAPLPLTRPVALTVKMLSASEALLTWADVSRESGYRIERGMAGGSGWTPLGEVAAGVTRYTDPGAGSSPRYRIVALGAGGESQPSRDVAPAPPRTPGSLAATALSPYAIRLAWTDVGGESGYRIERSADGRTGWTQIASVAAGVAAFEDRLLTAARPWTYRVSSFNFAGASAPSASVGATTWPESSDWAPGSWSGLVQPAGSFVHAHSGGFSIAMTPRGAFTGTLKLGARRIAVRGQFTPEGAAAGAIARHPGFVDGFTLALDAQTGECTGRLLLGSTEIALVRLVHTRLWTSAAPHPRRGAYTLLLTPDRADIAAPRGVGFGRVVVSASGRMVFAGALPGGIAISAGAPLSEDGDWPLHCPLHHGAGSLLGWSRIAEGRIASAAGGLRWTAPRRPGARVDRDAFSVAVNLAGASYVPRLPVWGEHTAMEFSAGGGDLNSLALLLSITIGPRNAVVAPGGSRLSVALSTATGLFSGSFVPFGGTRAHGFRGAILQPELRAGGFFHGPTRSGAVAIEQHYTGAGGVLFQN